ncbi:MAG: hypothetical protein L0Z50_34345 [Verrucomicrobiales bacterium]|nr:hypothetical protein [Verrucomicrobiales bacterium]
MKTERLCSFAFALAVSVHSSSAVEPKAPPRPAPTHADVSYGSHERNVLDFWQAKADQLGVEAHLKYPGAKPRYNPAVEFFKAKLLAS